MEKLIGISILLAILYQLGRGQPALRPTFRLIFFPLFLVKAVVWDSPKEAKGKLFAIIFLLWLALGAGVGLAVVRTMPFLIPLALLSILLTWYRRKFVAGRRLRQLPRRRRG